MTTFTITQETCKFGFHDHITLDPALSIPEQLNRKKLYYRRPSDTGNPLKIQKIIEENSSLRIDFGWSFEASAMFETIINECIEKITPKYNIGVNHMTSDARCSWIGFMPANTFEKKMYEELSLYGMIIFNNELTSYQEEVVEYIVSHKIYKQHSLTRDNRYRFNYMKSIRKNEDALVDAYWQYIEAIKDTIQLKQIPRDIIEEDLGCHFLYYPTLFFELISLTKLKGELYEWR